MKSYPYSEITVKQIILESRVARKTFYRNFLSKDDVLDAHIDSMTHEYIQSLTQLPDFQLSDILDIIFYFCIQHKDFLFQLRDNNLMHLLLNKWNVFIPMIHQQIVPPGHPLFQPFSAEQVDYIIALNVGAIWNVITKWVEHDMKESPDVVKATILNYLPLLL